MIDTPLNISCTPAILEDIEGLVALRKILLSNGSAHYAASSLTEDLAWQESYREWLNQCISARSKNIRLAVIRDTEKCLIGCAIGIVDQRAPMVDALNGLSGWIQSVVVAPQHCGKGFATLLTQHLFHWFGSLNVKTISLQTTPVAQSIYKRLGFESTGEESLIKHLDN
ncbi:GNAT family N-acetyltransferase [Serratia sp. D1N4]